MKIINNPGQCPIKLWTDGVPVEDSAVRQLENIASMPFIHKWVAAMPDVHFGLGATVGSVIATRKAIIPAAVGVDIGCGMVAVQTSLKASDLPDNLDAMRSRIESAVPHGRTANGGPGDRGAWGNLPVSVLWDWCQSGLGVGPFAKLCDKYSRLAKGNLENHMGTLGGGNHFIEVCLDLEQNVWIMLHSGSRGPGNRIGQFFIEKAKEEMERFFIHLPDRDLAYLPEGSEYFDDYCAAVEWAQQFASLNRKVMLDRVDRAIRDSVDKPYTLRNEAVNCHHNYIARENHYGENVWVTRKGAVRARQGDLGIIPGSMGARSFIVRGKGNPESFNSCSHGAGRVMSRAEAKRRFTVEDQVKATEGINCRKDAEVIDEIPMAYKDINDVMAAQADLVEVVAELRQVLCVKG